MYLDVADRAATDLTFVIKQLKLLTTQCNNGIKRLNLLHSINKSCTNPNAESTPKLPRGVAIGFQVRKPLKRILDMKCKD